MLIKFILLVIVAKWFVPDDERADLIIAILLFFDCIPDLHKIIINTPYCYYYKLKFHEEDLREYEQAKTDAEKQLIKKDIEEARSEKNKRKNRIKG